MFDFKVKTERGATVAELKTYDGSATIVYLAIFEPSATPRKDKVLFARVETVIYDPVYGDHCGSLGYYSSSMLNQLTN